VFEAFSFAPSCTAGCLFMLALFIRFANRRVRVFDVLGDKAYGLYLVHYLFSVWLQFLLLELVLPGSAAVAVVKAAIVFCGTVALSYAMVALIQRALSALTDERKRKPGAAVPS
jgi:peptidoglycan/LPS O-acetylase OafA/YrhL